VFNAATGFGGCGKDEEATVGTVIEFIWLIIRLWDTVALFERKWLTSRRPFGILTMLTAPRPPVGGRQGREIVVEDDNAIPDFPFGTGDVKHDTGTDYQRNEVFQCFSGNYASTLTWDSRSICGGRASQSSY
jgi:hypothetical protein